MILRDTDRVRKFIHDNYSELLEFHTVVPAVERLISDIQLNNNTGGMSSNTTQAAYA